MSEKCPVCSNELADPPRAVFESDARVIACPNCGQFELSFESWINLTRGAIEDQRDLALLSHKIRSMQQAGGWPKLSWELIGAIFRTSSLPSPAEQAVNMLLWLGDMGQFGRLVSLDPVSHSAIMGALDSDNFVAVVAALAERDLLRGNASSGGGFLGRLTLAGWEAYAEAKRGRADSRRAFMAMQYGDEMLDRVFAECFRPAVTATGFELIRLDVSAPAGLIDDRLRVEIRRSRFLIADLTHENRGAYWEAGYAEGLGKPVVYTCEQGYFEKQKTHFDTNHHLTICWSAGKLGEAAAALKNTIRGTLPAEAVMEDAGDGEADTMV